MRLCAVSSLALVLFVPVAAPAQQGAVSFNLSTSKTFAPGEQPKIHLYTHNVDALEFRVYRVNDPVKFVENLRELHSFGPGAEMLDKEQIDERTWLERFHDWKDDVWIRIRDFFRHQFSRDARAALRARQSSMTRRSRIVRAEEFAQVPLLNRSQLVARWRQLVPATFISDANDLAVPKLNAGLYLIEATDGRYKAYTLLVVTGMALVTRTGSGSVLAYTVDRVSGKPIAGVKVDAGFGQKLIATSTTGADGTALLAVPGDKSSPDNFWVVASAGSDVAVSTPGSWALTLTSGGKYTGYAFTERPVYRPTHTVHWKAILREHDGNALALPRSGSVRVTISDESDKSVFAQQMPLSASGTVSGDFTLPRGASLGYYTIQVGDRPEDAVNCGFHVEDYRKPEYRVQVTAGQKRVLEGAAMPVTIDSQYFFGEPVANARVKYRVYHEPHYWWGEDADGSDQDSSAVDSSDQQGYAGDEEAEQTGKLDEKGLLVIQVPTHVDGNGSTHADQDYVVEAGVTDSANREITGRGRFLATYGSFRVNIEPVSYAIHAGDAAKFKITALDYDDKPVSTRVHVQLIFRHYDNGKTQTIDGPAVEVTTDSSGHGSGELPVGTPQYSSAELQATASAVQPGTRDPIDVSYLWIMGAGEVGWDNSTETIQKMTVAST
jgi:alpha-2-macroglobulin